MTDQPPHLPVPAPAGTAFDDEVLAKLAELEKRSAQHEIDLRPQNTVEGYAADWEQWEAFCALLDLPVTAITPGSLTAFVEWLWIQPGWKAGTFTAPSIIDRRLSGVVVTGRAEYKLALDRTVAARARRVLKAKVRELQKTDEVRGRGPAPALLLHLRAGLDAAPTTRLGVRDRAIRPAAVRHRRPRARSGPPEAARHRRGRARPGGRRPRLQDQPPPGEGALRLPPLHLPRPRLAAWTQAAGLTDPDGYAFRALHPAGTPSPTAAWPPKPSATSSPASASGPTSPSGTPDTPPVAAPPRSPAAPATTARSSPSRADGSPTPGSWRATSKMPTTGRRTP
ncbi:hypothetical protein [Streptomyces platensis]|uniref:hypothetical protein n=1 Tax=Streptomyces platensis TaxID=58346 RepID=UPI003792FA7C